MVYTSPTNQNTVWIILDYDPSTDEYLWTIYHRDSGEISDVTKDWNKRSFVDSVYKEKIGHVELFTTTTTSTQTAQPTVGPTNNAIHTVKMREPLTVIYRFSTLEIEALDYYRGLYANDLAKTSNRYNEVPRENFEYLIIHPRVICKIGTTPVYISELSFKACIENTTRCYDSKPTVLTLPDFKDKYMKQYDKTDGWISFIVPTGITIKLAFVDLEDNPIGYILVK